jgi:hypothetical protein
MRDILKKLATGSMIAGAALFVAACGGGASNTATTNTDMGNDTMYDANADMGMDTNMTMDENMAAPDANMAAPDANAAAPDAGTAVDTNAAQ